ATYRLSLHDALPISLARRVGIAEVTEEKAVPARGGVGVAHHAPQLGPLDPRSRLEALGIEGRDLAVSLVGRAGDPAVALAGEKRSEEHTSELQSREK